MKAGWRIALLLASATLPATSLIGSPVDRRSNQPDIVVVVFDDLGFSDFGAYGSEIATPNIDALAKGGLRYNHFDTRAICSATRAALLTGRNNQTVRMADLPSRLLKPDDADTSKNKGELPANAQTVAEALRSAGYGTYAVGKWHLSPAYEGGPGGPADPGGAKRSWPLQRGFDHYYGFLGGWTDQYRPTLIADNQPVSTPSFLGYHLSADLVDHAIVDLDAGAASRKPTFLHLALGASHAPLQVPQSYIDRYRDTYAKGWDAIRAERFDRMRALGIVPPGTTLTGRASGDAAWNSLDGAHKRVFARFMAAYAGFITHADEQIGRLVEHLKRTGRFDNTLIVLLADNGAAGEGGEKGAFRIPYSDKTTVSDMDAHLDELGGPTTQPLYQRSWAYAGDTPFRRYKLWPYAGGTRDPLILSWPAGIKDRDAIRPQPVDAVDIAPTLLDVAGTHFAMRVGGIRQIPVAGRSVRASFASSTASAGRSVQYFELRGNRAIRSGRWKAVAMHQPGTSFDTDTWKLFDTSTDFSEAVDLAARHPAVTTRLQRLWWREARRYASPPISEMPPALRTLERFDEP